MEITGHRKFDKMVAQSPIGSGNIFGDMQTSGYLRAVNHTSRPDGEQVQPGELHELDLKFCGAAALAPALLEVIRQLSMDQQTCFYHFHTPSKRNGQFVRVSHGYLLLSPEGKVLWERQDGMQAKSRAVFEACKTEVIRQTAERYARQPATRISPWAGAVRTGYLPSELRC
jgi:hypothetical protein